MTCESVRWDSFSTQTTLFCPSQHTCTCTHARQASDWPQQSITMIRYQTVNAEYRKQANLTVTDERDRRERSPTSADDIIYFITD